jgi:hypothetical protein
LIESGRIPYRHNNRPGGIPISRSWFACTQQIILELSFNGYHCLAGVVA